MTIAVNQGGILDSSELSERRYDFDLDDVIFKTERDNKVFLKKTLKTSESIKYVSLALCFNSRPCIYCHVQILRVT